LRLGLAGRGPMIRSRAHRGREQRHAGTRRRDRTDRRASLRRAL